MNVVSPDPWFKNPEIRTITASSIPFYVIIDANNQFIISKDPNKVKAEGCHQASLKELVSKIDETIKTESQLNAENIDQMLTLLVLTKRKTESPNEADSKSADATIANLQVLAFLKAAEEGNFRGVSDLLSKNINLIDKQDSQGNTALHLAAKKGRGSLVALLLSRGARLDFKNNDGNTPLHLAAMAPYNRIESNVDMMQSMLLSDQFRMRPKDLYLTKNKDGDTPLHLACRSESLDCQQMVMLLVNNFHEIRNLLQERNKLGQCPLHVAAQNKKMTPTIIAFLITSDATKKTISSKDINNKTPLHLACEAGSTVFIRTMISEFRDFRDFLYEIDSNNRNPIHLAALNGQIDTLAAILPGIGDPELLFRKDANGQTIFNLAEAYDKEHETTTLQTIKSLIDWNRLMSGDLQMLLDEEDNKEVHVKFFIDFVDQLINFGDIGDRNFLNALKAELQRFPQGPPEAIAKAIGNIKKMLDENEIPVLFFRALERNQRELIPILFKHKLYIADEHGNFPLYLAIKQGNIDFASDILRHARDISSLVLFLQRNNKKNIIDVAVSNPEIARQVYLLIDFPKILNEFFVEQEKILQFLNSNISQGSDKFERFNSYVAYGLHLTRGFKQILDVLGEPFRSQISESLIPIETLYEDLDVTVTKLHPAYHQDDLIQWRNLYVICFAQAMEPFQTARAQYQHPTEEELFSKLSARIRIDFLDPSQMSKEASREYLASLKNRVDASARNAFQLYSITKNVKYLDLETKLKELSAVIAKKSTESSASQEMETKEKAETIKEKFQQVQAIFEKIEQEKMLAVLDSITPVVAAQRALADTRAEEPDAEAVYRSHMQQLSLNAFEIEYPNTVLAIKTAFGNALGMGRNPPKFGTDLQDHFATGLGLDQPTILALILIDRSSTPNIAKWGKRVEIFQQPEFNQEEFEKWLGADAENRSKFLELQRVGFEAWKNNNKKLIKKFNNEKVEEIKTAITSFKQEMKKLKEEFFTREKAARRPEYCKYLTDNLILKTPTLGKPEDDNQLQKTYRALQKAVSAVSLNQKTYNTFLPILQEISESYAKEHP